MSLTPRSLPVSLPTPQMVGRDFEIARILDVYKSRDILSMNDAGLFAVGFITAFLAALIAIRFLLRFVASHDFKVFAWYRIVFGVLVLLYFL